MLGIGMQEILIILVVALIVIGPKRLPELARTLGKGFAEFRKAADDLQETVRIDLQREQQEEFKKKYPDLVPDEDESPEPDPASASPSTGDDLTTKTSEAQTDAAADRSESEPEPELSYNPDEIEGGDEADDDSRDA